jgi:uncharacterized protein YunC (DUF1805 family)
MSAFSDIATAAAFEFLRTYHRHTVEVDAAIPDTPVLFVANHGFGGVGDLDVAASHRALAEAAVVRPTTTR